MHRVTSLELHLKHREFLEDMSQALQPTPSEATLIRGVDPIRWAYWSTAVLAGDEIAPFPNRANDLAVPFLAAEGVFRGRPILDYQTGELAGRVQSMYESQDPRDRERFKQLSRTLANWTFVVGNAIGIEGQEWRKLARLFPQTLIRPDRSGALHVTFPGDNTFAFSLDGPAENILNFGPGLAVAAQASVLTGHTKTIDCVSGGMGAAYINSWAEVNMGSSQQELQRLRRVGRLAAMLSPQLDPARVMLPQLLYSANGIAERVESLPRRARFDVALMSSVHSAGVEECRAGVVGAARFLRLGGLFVLKAPDVSLGSEAGMDRVAEFAASHLGEPVAQGPCGRLEQDIDPEREAERTASFAIFRKR